MTTPATKTAAGNPRRLTRAAFVLTLAASLVPLIVHASAAAAAKPEKAATCPNGLLKEKANPEKGCVFVNYPTACPRGYIWPEPDAKNPERLCKPISNYDDAAQSEHNFYTARSLGLAPVDRDGQPVSTRIMDPDPRKSGSYIKRAKCPEKTYPALSHKPKTGDMRCVASEAELETGEEYGTSCTENKLSGGRSCDCCYGRDGAYLYSVRREGKATCEPDSCSPFIDLGAPSLGPSKEECERQTHHTQTLDPACLKYRAR